jgi:16S rRNA (guanine527-N7)-methyltransferase
MSYRNLLREGAAEVGAPLEEEQAEKLLLYLEKIREWNEVMNLTSTSEPRELILKHLVDSLSCVPFLPLTSGVHLIDVGSGAGFPGLVLKIYRPDVRLSLLESSRKRCSFLEYLVARLNLGKTELLRGRAEAYGQEVQHREQYRVAVSRAVASLRILAEYCLPFLKVGGLFICQKGPKGREEIREAREALRVLGGEVAAVKEIVLPGAGEKRILISLRKSKQTPIRYPRRSGVPKKRPL